jgi:hypothetical protein
MEISSDNSSKSTSVNVLMINAQGVMISVQGEDFFISYNRAPWLRNATISNALNVKMSGKHAIEWPDLDIDFEIIGCKRNQKNREPTLATNNFS